MTPFEIVRFVRARDEDDQTRMVVVAWTQASMSGAAFSGKLKGIETYLPRKRVTDDEAQAPSDEARDEL